MPKNILRSFIISSLFIFTTINAQWVKTSYEADGYIQAMVVCDNTIFVADQSNGIQMSTDNGSTWTDANEGLPSSNSIEALICDGTVLYVTVRYNGVYSSIDGGSTWTAKTNGLPSTDHFSSLAASENNLFVATNSGVYFSADSGNTWNATNSGLINLDVRSLGVIGEYVFAFVYGDSLYRSALNSINWINVNDGFPNYSDVNCFASDTTKPNEIYVGTDDGVYFSDNNGTSWSARNNGMRSPVVTSLVLAEDNVYATMGSNDGGVMVSEDNGSNWSYMNDGFSEFPYSGAIVIKESTIFVGGAEKSVWSRPLSQLTSVEDESLGIPSEYSLSQNYPNPFNPTTTIKYSIPMIESQNIATVQLRIYDVLGKEVATLVNQKQNTGNYSVEINASNLPSGIYFYSLQTDNFTSVKKMTLLK